MDTRDKFSIPDNQRTQIHNDMHRLITGYKYIVMCVLIQHSDKDGYCFPSEKTISGGIASEKTVSRAIAELEKRGYITVGGRKSTSLHTNLSYNINFDKLYTDIESLSPNNKHQTNSPVS